MFEETAGYSHIKQVTLKYVEAMKVGETPGLYQKEAGEGISLYGSYHAAHILDIFGGLQKFTPQEIDTWADFFHAKQTDQGYYSNNPDHKTVPRTIEELEPIWHTTRGVLWTLRVLDRKPQRPLDFLEPLLDAKALYQWVKHYNWANSWAAGNQVLACATALMAARDWFGISEVDQIMEEGMYPALEEVLDDQTGFWGTHLGSDLPSGLFGTIHITPIYFAQGWPLRAVDRNVDSTIACQLEDGSYWPGGSDCPDFDGAYMLANLAELTDYRREDMETAARKYLAHAMLHESADGVGWLLHRRDSQPSDWRPRPHFIWREGQSDADAELRDDDPDRTHIMLGSWFYPLSIALIAHMLRDTAAGTGFEGPYRLNRMSLHQCNVFTTYDTTRAEVL